MITVVYCTRNENKKHQEHLFKSSGLHKKLEIIEIINNGESLTKAYNRGLKQAKNDLVVFCHDDIELPNNWGKKLLKHFNKSDYGIIGVAGTKYLSESGQWWSDPSKMYGRVQHTNEGKSWLSAYSGDLGNKIEEVVLVDGLFFAVDKKRIKLRFDESVEGFHFYDVDFCFRNHLEGVKVGVITDIRVNHFSIGLTNDKWGENRVKFSEKYKTELPVKINETFENRKMKVLIGCLNLQSLTGSELYVLELAKQLSNLNCDVSVVSLNISNNFKQIFKKHDIKTYLMSEPPGYKLGDGRWGVNTQQGFQLSKEGVLYPLKPVNFDIIHTNHTPITEQLLKLYPDKKFISTIGSEVIDLEKPVINDKLNKFIVVRPSIKDYIVNDFGIDEDNVEVVYNPFDTKRFKPFKKTKYLDEKVVLFVGTMDYLRKTVIVDIIRKTKEDGMVLHLVGMDETGYAKQFSLDNEHVRYFEPTDKIEEHFHNCDITAGIMLGRTTIEGFLCGKPGVIYNVDKYGNILNETLHKVPEDMSIFDSNMTTNKIINIYKEVINE